MAHQMIDSYLENNSIPHRWITHAPAYTAQEVAATSHIKGRDFAKTVVVKLNGKLAMIVMPANEKLVPSRLRKMVGVNALEIPEEDEFVEKFPDCEPGAMPPFGKLYGMPVFVSDTLSGEHEIAFTAGSHRDCVKLSYKDFERLEHPRIGHFSEEA